MDLSREAASWHRDGFVVLTGYLPAEELAAARSELGSMFPSADDFHDAVDPARNARFIGDEFAGIDTFPFASAEVSLLAVHDRLVQLAVTLLNDGDVRLYTAETWAKYAGAAGYDQSHHRDYLNHTILVPTGAPTFQQVEMFVYLVDVTVALGAPRLLPRSRTADLPAKPNFYLPTEGSDSEAGFVSTTGHPALYEAEIAATGPAGTVVAFEAGTFHRGAAVTEPRGARYSMHLGYRPAAVEWGQRQAWADRSHDPAWYAFVERATPRQLELVGFPPPGHPYWTSETLTGVALRYPGLDLAPWQEAIAGAAPATPAAAPRRRTRAS